MSYGQTFFDQKDEYEKNPFVIMSMKFGSLRIKMKFKNWGKMSKTLSLSHSLSLSIYIYINFWKREKIILTLFFKERLAYP
jgi:hypothetical protein